MPQAAYLPEENADTIATLRAQVADWVRAYTSVNDARHSAIAALRHVNNSLFELHDLDVERLKDIRATIRAAIAKAEGRS